MQLSRSGELRHDRDGHAFDRKGQRNRKQHRRSYEGEISPETEDLLQTVIAPVRGVKPDRGRSLPGEQAHTID